MCGICGIVDYEHVDPERDKSEVARMCEVLHHRGPDDHGLYSDDTCTMGNTRLAIIGVADGHQPLCNEDGTLWVTFNGEIYNYLQLRDELIQMGHVFKTNTDTEVLVHGFEEFGTGLLQRLNGMFAFAVWDCKRGRLTVCRDRAGIKPVYYYHDRGRWVFASEIKALLQDLRNTRKIDVSVICDYLAKQDFFSNESIYAGINLLPAGSYLTITARMSRLDTYWRPTFTSYGPRPESEEDGLRRLVPQAIRNQLISEVPIGAHLSGGLDSSAIVHFASERIGRGLPVFTCGLPDTPEYDESTHASTVARIEGVQPWTTALTSSYLRAHIEELVASLEEPRFNPGVILNDAVAELAKKHVAVVLTGQGGDELFGGYDRFSIAAFWHYLFWTRRHGRGRLAFSNVSYAMRTLGPKVFLYDSILYLLGPYGIGLSILERYHRSVVERLLAPKYVRWSREGHRKETVRVVRPIMMSEAFRALGPIQRMLWLDIATFLNYLLVTEDKIEMRHSLEARVPLLDNCILDFVGHLNPDALAGASPTKDLVRLALREFLPSSVVDRPKMGSPIPIGDWFRGDLRDLIARHLLNPHLSIGDIIDSRRIRRLVEEHFSRKKDNSEMIWRLLVLEIWYRQYVTGSVERLTGPAKAFSQSGKQEGEKETPLVKALFVYEKPSSFILGDLRILRMCSEVTEFRWQRPREVLELLEAVVKTDVVYAWYANLSAVIVGLLCKTLRRRFILVPAGSDVSAHPYGGALRRPLYRFVPMIALRLASEVLAVSETSKKDILTIHKKAPCQRVYNGVDPELFAPGGPKERMVLSVGSLDENTIENKGYRILLKVARSMPGVRFVIVGDLVGSDAESLRRGAPTNVEFSGTIPRDKLVELYKRAWVYVALSHYESFGVAVVEAMMSGCVPVLSDIPTFREIGDPVAEFAARDAQRVASAIKRAFARSDGENVRAWATSRFSIDKRAAELRQIMEAGEGQ